MQNNPAHNIDVQQLYKHAAYLLMAQRRMGDTVVKELRIRGLDNDTATTLVAELESELAIAKKQCAQKDVFFGSLWLAGGGVLTVAHVSSVFWGATILGVIQLSYGIVEQIMLSQTIKRLGR